MYVCILRGCVRGTGVHTTNETFTFSSIEFTHFFHSQAIWAIVNISADQPIFCSQWVCSFCALWISILAHLLLAVGRVFECSWPENLLRSIRFDEILIRSRITSISAPEPLAARKCGALSVWFLLEWVLCLCQWFCVHCFHMDQTHRFCYRNILPTKKNLVTSTTTATHKKWADIFHFLHYNIYFAFFSANCRNFSNFLDCLVGRHQASPLHTTFVNLFRMFGYIPSPAQNPFYWILGT